MEISEKICFLIVYSPAVGDHGTYSYGVVRVLDSYWNRGSNGWLHGYRMENLQYEIKVSTYFRPLMLHGPLHRSTPILRPPHKLLR